MKTYYNTIKESLLEAGFMIKKINDRWGLYSEAVESSIPTAPLIDSLFLGELLSKVEVDYANLLHSDAVKAFKSK